MSPDASPPRVLLVGSDVRAIVDRLRRAGIEVRVFDTAAEALGHARSGRPEVVLLDLASPDAGDGLRRLVEVAPDVPVVALGREDDERAQEALRRGAHDLVDPGATPVDRVVRHTVERHRLQRQLDQMLRRESALVRLGHLALEGTSLTALVGPITEAVTDALRADAAALLVRGGTGVRVLGGHGWEELSFPLEVPDEARELAKAVMEDATTLQCADLSAELGADSVLARLGFTSGAASPITGRVGGAGVLAVFDRAARVYTASEIEFLEAMGRALGEAERRGRAEAALRERIKEQTAVAAVARLVQAHPTRSSLLPGVAEALLPSLQHPHLTGVRVVIDGEEAVAGPQELAVELRAPIVVDGARRGHLRVGYRETRAFLDEEHSLLHTVAGSIAAWIAADDAQLARERSDEHLRALVEQRPGYVWTTDPDLVVTSMTGSPLQGARDEPVDVVGTSMLTLAATGDAVEVVERAHRQALAGEPATYLWMAGGHTWQCQIRPLRDREGAIRGAIGGATDITAEREAEAALRRSEERFRALVERASDVVAIVGDQFEILFVSPASGRVTGHPPEELVGRPITAFLADADARALADHWQEVLDTAEPVGPLVHRLRHRDGSWRYVEVVHTNRRSDAAIGGVIVNLRDVTDRVQTQQALRESEARFRRLAENAPDVIYRVALQPEPHFEYVSPAVEALLGYPPQAFYDDPDTDRRLLLDPGQSVLEKSDDEGLRAVLAMRHRDGSVRFVERRAVVVRDRSGEPVAIEAIARDVTAARQTEEALRSSEARLARVLETMSEGLLMFDGVGVVTYANPAAVSVFEATREELVGRRYDDPAWAFTSPDGSPLPAEERVVQRVLATGQPLQSVVLSRLAKDGELRSWEASGQPLRDEEGRLTGVVVSLRDVTERLRADQAMRAALERERVATERLRHADQMKTGFLQAVSHELRTPLTSVIGFSALLRRHAELPSEQVELLTERLAVNARKLDRLLADLLDVDRLSRGTIEARRTSVDVGALLRSVVAEIEGPTTRVTVRTAAAAIAEIDGPRTERIVENLVLNALRHTEGPVEVGAETVEEGVLLWVGDRGTGVPDEAKDTLFDPFQQGDTPAARVGGAGIGLTVVRTFAELHGGRAWVEDRPGGGALFRVLLPTGRSSPEDAA